MVETCRSGNGDAKDTLAALGEIDKPARPSFLGIGEC